MENSTSSFSFANGSAVIENDDDHDEDDETCNLKREKIIYINGKVQKEERTCNTHTMGQVLIKLFSFTKREKRTTSNK